MLEKASLEEIVKLRLMPGKEVAVFVVKTVAMGTVVRVTTASGNHYLFEIADPAVHRAHVVRCDSRGPDSSGYRGERVVSAVFRIGDKILHGGAKEISYTSAVAGITILPKEVLS